jgi:hypothetical protein
LAALLSAGLAELGERPVDVGDLLDGARAGARQLRRRRRAAGVTALAVVVIGVPLVLVGTGLVGGHPRTQLADPNGGGAAGPTTEPYLSGVGPGDVPTGPVVGTLGGPDLGASAPDGTRVSQSTAQVLSQDASGQYTIGDQALLHATDLAPIGSPPQTDDQATVTAAGPTPTPVCRTLPAASTRAAAAHGATYASTGVDGWTVRLVVRVLPGSAATVEMSWLKRSMGTCAGELQLRRATVTGLPGDGVVLGYQVGADPRSPRAVLVIGAVQHGRTTSAVELVVPAGAGGDSSARVAAGLAQAKRLLALADQRLKGSGLVSAAQNDPSLRA